MERAVALVRDGRVEMEYILVALAQNDGNQARTALQRRIGSATLYRKLKGYGLIPARRPAGRGATGKS